MPSEPFRVLAVCTGNTCRSPFAEGYLRLALQRAGFSAGVEVASAGVFAGTGYPASPSAIQVAETYGVDLSEFRCQMAIEDLLEEQHLILTLDETHEDYLLEHNPSVAERIRPLGAYVSPSPVRSIADPMGGDLQVFESTFELIASGVDGLVADWPDAARRFYQSNALTFAVGCDHRGFELKNHIKAFLARLGFDVLDVGTHDACSCDHPDYAFQVGELVAMRQADRGVLICSSGHGMVIAVNKVQGIRGVVPFNQEHAEVARHHNNANVLCMPADYISREECERILNAFVYTEFLGGKYQRRINMIARAERVHESDVVPV